MKYNITQLPTPQMSISTAQNTKEASTPKSPKQYPYAASNKDTTSTLGMAESAILPAVTVAAHTAT